MKCLKGISVFFAKKVTQFLYTNIFKVSLLLYSKCLFTNACSIANKQEELEITVQQGSYDLITITEI